jgi:DNA-binding NtrC family response regulator
MKSNAPDTAMTILIVEDDEGLARVISRRLEAMGYTPKHVSTGKNALAWLETETASLMLLDYVLPDMKGQKIIETLNSRQKAQAFITMTGRGDEKVAVEMMKIGALDYLVKDGSFLELVAPVVRRALSQIDVRDKLAQAERDRTRLMEELKTALAQVNVLRDLLPICPQCKKRRDEQSYWKQIEGYIHEHSEVQFTHGLCPDCTHAAIPGSAPQRLDQLQ